MASLPTQQTFAPKEYLEARANIDPMLDMRESLKTIAQTYQSPNTSYFGLSPENIEKSSSQTASYLKQYSNMIMDAKKTAADQQRAAFADAITAHNAYMSDKHQAFTEQMERARLALSQAANARAAAESAELSKIRAKQLELLEDKVKYGLTEDIYNVNGKDIKMSRNAAHEFGLALNSTNAKNINLNEELAKLDEVKASDSLKSLTKTLGSVLAVSEKFYKKFDDARENFEKNDITGKSFDTYEQYLVNIGFSQRDATILANSVNWYELMKESNTKVTSSQKSNDKNVDELVNFFKNNPDILKYWSN